MKIKRNIVYLLIFPLTLIYSCSDRYNYEPEILNPNVDKSAYTIIRDNNTPKVFTANEIINYRRESEFSDWQVIEAYGVNPLGMSKLIVLPEGQAAFRGSFLSLVSPSDLYLLWECVNKVKYNNEKDLFFLFKDFNVSEDGTSISMTNSYVTNVYDIELLLKNRLEISLVNKNQPEYMTRYKYTWGIMSTDEMRDYLVFDTKEEAAYQVLSYARELWGEYVDLHEVYPEKYNNSRIIFFDELEVAIRKGNY